MPCEAALQVGPEEADQICWCNTGTVQLFEVQVLERLPDGLQATQFIHDTAPHTHPHKRSSVIRNTSSSPQMCNCVAYAQTLAPGALQTLE